MDMSRFIIAKSDQLNADDLLGGPRIITITGVRGTDAADQPVAVSYEGDGGKPYKPCKSMRRVMVHCWGKDAAQYAGRSMELYCDPDVQFGGMKVGGIRISRMSHIDGPKQMALTATRGKKGLYKVQPLTDAPQQPAQQDFSETLSQLKALARPGNIAALQDEWQRIGPDARKALAAELPALKETCSLPTSQPSDDVPFDAPAQQTGADYDGA
jgi:hypothetical protein